jgi:hypothetical protein
MLPIKQNSIHKHLHQKPIITISFNESEQKFTIYENKKVLGNFNNTQLIKYLTNSKDIDTLSAKSIIETYICKFDDTGKIVLLNHLQSPFMGNIELIMKLYNSISNKEHDIIKQFSYLLLNHSLKLINSISNIIKHDANKQGLKTMLIKYTMIINHKLNNFIKQEIENKSNDFKSLQNDLIRMGKIKIELYKKIDDINNTIKSQNELINNITRKLDETKPSNPEKIITSAKELNPEKIIITSAKELNEFLRSSSKSSNDHDHDLVVHRKQQDHDQDLDQVQVDHGYLSDDEDIESLV